MPKTPLAAALAALLTLAVAPAALAKADKLDKINHFVVVYEENHSFDNLYGGWEGVDGLAGADAAHTTQVDQAGAPYPCLLQNDVNLTVPPLSPDCNSNSHFANAPFGIDQYVPASATTCPAPGQSASNGVQNGQGQAGGCTRDLVHRFYQEQYQIDGGAQDRYTTGSDAVGLTMGHYDTTQLPIYKYLHSGGHPHYAIADNFFQGAFGGSFLNHQWLIAARTPTWDGAPAAQHSAVDANGMPTSYPLYTAQGSVADKALTSACPAAKPGLLCGDYAVNTIQPTYQPHGGGAQLPPLTTPTIGDRLSAKGVDWAWYSGGWSNADGDVGAPGWTNGDGPDCGTAAVSGSTFPNCPDKLFQFHHQPFNYYAAYAPGTQARKDHLRDEAEFLDLASGSHGNRCALKPVSFVKPIGAENEHPGYASEPNGSDHLVDVLRTIEDGGCAKDTMVVVTYDEFGGAWDHVPPPGQAGGPAGPSDQSGPGTRVPALILAPGLRGNFAVDSTEHDTTSILATLEHRFDVAPLGSRDADVPDLASVFSAHEVRGGR